MKINCFSIALIALPLLPVARARAQATPPDAARQLATAASIALDEYALGVRDGRVVRAEEIDEAKAFLARARAEVPKLPPGLARRTDSVLARLQRGVAAHVPVDSLRPHLAGLRSDLERALGISLDPLPAEPPSLVRGQALFHEQCASCHGPRGAGDGPAGRALSPPPANLTARRALHDASPLEFFRKISLGVAGTAMPAFEQQLSVQDRWALALYVSGLRYDAAERAAGAAAVAQHCPGCAVVLSGFAETIGMDDDSLAALLGAASGDTADLPAMVAYGRTAAAREVLGGNARLQALRVASTVDAGVAQAGSLAAKGDRTAAARRALDSYAVFERLENAVAARDAPAAAAVERAFIRFRGALASGTDAEVVAAQRHVREALARTVDVMSRSASPTVLFGQSLIIILREGLEAILILAALTAFVARAGAEHRTREISWGAGVAVLASFLTAGAFATVIHSTAASREALEGLTLLLAASVLFWVASWLVSKIEAEKWRAFVGMQTERALSSGSRFALGGVAFLAVYREGVETVLFYGALFGTAQSATGTASVAAGLAVGGLVLIGVYIAIQRYGLRLPLRPFFAVTGILLSMLAVSFAGQGVAELQAAGWLSATPVPGMPSIPAIGLYPTIQTLTAQGIVLAAFGVAASWIFSFKSPQQGEPTTEAAKAHHVTR